MDLSAVIFVALAVAWAVYLVPKALKHHDEVARTRSVDRFSATMRTLARRDPVPSVSAGGRVVVTPGRPASTSHVTTKPHASDAGDPTPAERRVRSEAARMAAQRRRRVLGTLLLALGVAVGTGAAGVVSWWITAAPGALIVMWLVACRAMVRGERRGRAVARVDVGPSEVVEADYPSSYDVRRTEEGFDEVGPAAETSRLDGADVDAELWEPRPVTLPTYVGKDIAPLRHAKMLHKDDSGVWTSGHDTSDSIVAQTARDADRDGEEREDRTDWDGAHRAVGS